MGDAWFGPLAGPECRRSLGRTWVWVVRTLAPLPPALVVLGVFWTWWFWGQFSSRLAPQEVVRIGLILVEGILLTIALVLTPALLAGSLAGEKGRSTLVLLLASQVSSGEIVLARLVGQLSVIGAILLAGLPALALLAALRGLGLFPLSILIGLPMAVAFGGGGLAVAASAFARRGRDALLLIYLLDLVFLLVPLFGSSLSTAVQEWLEPLNPYQGVDPLVAWEEVRPALLTIGLWTLLGVAGTCGAAWRLRPACLRDLEGRPARGRLFRRAVPPVSDRPLVWKERYIEQTQTFSRVVYWLGFLVVVVYVGTSMVLASLVAWETWTRATVGWADWAKALLAAWMGAAEPISWVVQWSLGLRAAAAIAGERQRGTWDTLLATPLEGREIVGAKIYGGLHGLRAWVVAVLLAWTLGLLCGALSWGEYGTLVGNTVIAGAFIVVMGIGCSLACSTATRAMTLVILVWLGAAVGTAALAALIVLLVGVVAMLVWLQWTAWTGGFATGVMPRTLPFGAWFEPAYVISRWAIYGVAALAAAEFFRRRFDRLAGRSFPEPTRLVRIRKRLQRETGEKTSRS
jgi:ABC-type transport system involved in multi-copper enzyme maturation permease subunit